MKKILLSLFFVMSSSHAQQSVTVYWPFGLSDGQGLHVRALLDRANEMQNKFYFVMMPVTGAGGSVAANRALSSKEPALLATTSSFFIRPLVYSNSNYRFDDFRPVSIMSSSPMALVSRKDFDAKELSTDKQLYIGIAGLGTTSHVITYQIKLRTPGLTLVPYRSLNETLRDLRSGQVHLSLDLVKSAQQHSDLKIIGLTGGDRIDDIPLLSDLGFNGLEMLTISLMLLAPVELDASLVEPIKDVLYQAAQDNSRLDRLYDQDRSVKVNVPKTQFDTWYLAQIENMRNFTKNIKIE